MNDFLITKWNSICSRDYLRPTGSDTMCQWCLAHFDPLQTMPNVMPPSTSGWQASNSLEYLVFKLNTRGFWLWRRQHMYIGYADICKQFHHTWLNGVQIKHWTKWRSRMGTDKRWKRLNTSDDIFDASSWNVNFCWNWFQQLIAKFHIEMFGMYGCPTHNWPRACFSEHDYYSPIFLLLPVKV